MLRRSHQIQVPCYYTLFINIPPLTNLYNIRVSLILNLFTTKQSPHTASSYRNGDPEYMTKSFTWIILPKAERPHESLISCHFITTHWINYNDEV